MTTFSLQKSRRPKSKTFLLRVLVMLVVVAALVCLNMFAGGTVSKISLAISRPFASTFTTLTRGFSFGSGFLSTKTHLMKENETLRAHIVANEAETLRLKIVEREYDQLLASYSRSASSTARDLVLANVIAKPPQSPYDVLVVDVGQDHGVVKNDRVYGPGEVLIGRIDEVVGATAKVVMFSTVGEKSEAIVERTSESISVEGTGGGNLKAEIPQDMDITIGDSVVLPVFDGAVIATVVSIDTSVTSAFKEALFKVPFNMFNLRWVTIAR